MKVAKWLRRGRPAVEMMRALLQAGGTHKIQGTSRYVDAAESKGVSTISHQHGSLEISGLDPDQLKDDPIYLYRVLFMGAATLIDQARKIMGNAPIKDIWGVLLQHPVSVALVTRDEGLQELIKAMKPVAEEQMTSAPYNKSDLFACSLGDDWGTTSKVYFFDFMRIMRMTMEDESLSPVFEDAKNHVHFGRHFQIHRHADPDLY